MFYGYLPCTRTKITITYWIVFLSFFFTSVNTLLNFSLPFSLIIIFSTALISSDGSFCSTGSIFVSSGFSAISGCGCSTGGCSGTSVYRNFFLFFCSFFHGTKFFHLFIRIFLFRFFFFLFVCLKNIVFSISAI